MFGPAATARSGVISTPPTSMTSAPLGRHLSRARPVTLLCDPSSRQRRPSRFTHCFSLPISLRQMSRTFFAGILPPFEASLRSRRTVRARRISTASTTPRTSPFGDRTTRPMSPAFGLWVVTIAISQLPS